MSESTLCFPDEVSPSVELNEHSAARERDTSGDLHSATGPTQGDDDTMVSLAQLQALDEQQLRTQSSRPIILKCRLQFTSERPVSFSRPIRFEDQFGFAADLLFTATADNSIFTCYPFLAKHRDDFRIVTEQVIH